MDYRITQCPRCGTSFRVTDTHLAVAAGAVRCGSCLHIFNAPDYWLEEPEAERPAGQDAQPDEAANADHDWLIDDDSPLIDDDLLIDDDTPLFSDEEEPAGAPPLFQPPPPQADQPIAVADFLDSAWEPELRNGFDNDDPLGSDISVNDESWAEELLEEDPLGPLEEPPGFDERFSQFEEILAQAPQVSEDETDSLDLAPEFLQLETTPLQATRNDPATTEAAPLEPVPEPAPAPAVSEPEALTAEQPFGGAGARLLDRGALLGSFEPEPLQLRRVVREPRWPRLLWATGLVLALGLLVFQYIHFNFDRLARGDSRAWLAQLCAVVGCELPTQYDLSAIHTSSLIVRSHPSQRNALAVDAILTNTAAFSQPYPKLLLQFTDLDGEPVAGRLFSAEEYLGGELTGTRLMPSQQPIHIGLEVKDPGPRAVNYQLQVSGG
jgi:predicted Zn finger-like uncharacterized protein